MKELKKYPDSLNPISEVSWARANNIFTEKEIAKGDYFTNKVHKQIKLLF